MKRINWLLILLICSTLYGNDDIENLLGEFAQKSDLSKETKIKNAGHTVIYTRSDIEKMQARNLKDIVKSIPFFNYLESRYNIPNLNPISEFVPFSSSQIRIYLDNHEITSGIYGSVFPYMGNIELEFVDHIELYFSVPSFEYTKESTYILIKLHTKVPQRDSGGKLLLSGGSYGFNQESLYYTQKIQDFSYFAYMSKLNDKRDNPTINGVEVNKDKTTNHFIGTLFNDKHHLLINAMQVNQKLAGSVSLDATSTISQDKYNNLQVSYQNNIFENITAKLSYQHAKDSLITADDKTYAYTPSSDPVNLFRYNAIEKVTSTEINYANSVGANDFLAGVSTRFKNFDFKTFETNQGLAKDTAFDTQNTYSAYLQNEYSIADSSIATGGVKYSLVSNNGEFSDNYLTMYRLGITNTFGDLTAKLFYYHTPSIIEPYLFASFYSKNKNLKLETTDSAVLELNYTLEQSIFRILFSKCTIENALFYNNPSSSIDNLKNNMDTHKMGFDYSYDFSPLHNLKLGYFTNDLKDSPVGNYRQQGGFVRLLNTFGRIDIFNEIVYRENSLDKKDWYDYSAGVKYSYSNSLAFSIKGENILDKATKQEFTRVDPTTHQALSPLISTPIDRKFYFTMEYMF